LTERTWGLGITFATEIKPTAAEDPNEFPEEIGRLIASLASNDLPLTQTNDIEILSEGDELNAEPPQKKVIYES